MIILYEDFTKYPSTHLSTDLWNYQTGGHGWGNKELQYYTTNDKNLYIDKEGLHIKAIRENFDKNTFTSARITSKVLFKYGKISFKFKLPKHVGTWPAIWMISEEAMLKHNWPACGEIDLMEFVGRMNDTIHISLHCKDFNHTLNNHRTILIPIKDEEYHEMEIIWDQDGFRGKIDNVYYDLFKKPSDATYGSWNFDQRFFLIMNMAIGGNFAGKVDDKLETDEFVIQYIKVEDINNAD